MRKNKFSSAADRRWQRRYERIQQRKEEERERKEIKEQEEFYQQYIHDMDMHPLVNQQITSPTFTVTLPRFDEPNLNGTVITREAYETAMREFSQSTADTTQRSLAEALIDAANDRVDDSVMERIEAFINEQIYREFTRAAENYRSGLEIHEQATQNGGRGYRTRIGIIDDWFDGFVDVKNVPFGDRAILGVDLAGGAEIPEPDLDAGDNSALDSFLGEFLAPGA